MTSCPTSSDIKVENLLSKMYIEGALTSKSRNIALNFTVLKTIFIQ